MRTFLAGIVPLLCCYNFNFFCWTSTQLKLLRFYLRGNLEVRATLLDPSQVDDRLNFSIFSQFSSLVRCASLQNNISRLTQKKTKSVSSFFFMSCLILEKFNRPKKRFWKKQFSSTIMNILDKEYLLYSGYSLYPLVHHKCK